MPDPKAKGPEIDVYERAASRDGGEQAMNRRLFMQLQVFDVAPGADVGQQVERLATTLEQHEVPSVIYADVSVARGLGVLAWSENPEHLVTRFRPALTGKDLAALNPRPSFAMFGRTYASGFEPDLEYWLLRRPRDTVLNPAWPWAVWYPLRRGGSFERLEPRDKGMIMREHAEIGKAYGAADLAHDVRLACHGLDAADNEFVIGLIGKELHPLSHVVQAMRKTRQTSEYIVQMGPFFIGHVAWRSKTS